MEMVQFDFRGKVNTQFGTKQFYDQKAQAKASFLTWVYNFLKGTFVAFGNLILNFKKNLPIGFPKEYHCRFAGHAIFDDILQ